MQGGGGRGGVGFTIGMNGGRQILNRPRHVLHCSSSSSEKSDDSEREENEVIPPP